VFSRSANIAVINGDLSSGFVARYKQLTQKSNPIQFPDKYQRSFQRFWALGKCYQSVKVGPISGPTWDESPRFARFTRNNSMPEQSQFIYVTCQVGSEALCKAELAAACPDWKFSFSKRGFLTFKLPDDAKVDDKFLLKSTFARSYGWSVGNLKSDDALELATKLAKHPAFREAKHLHVWQRDKTVPGNRGFEPGQSALAQQVGEAILGKLIRSGKPLLNRRAQPDELVFDVVLVEPDWWWFGWHQVGATFQRWPGGVPMFEIEPKISRAYYKLKEALLWSGIHVRPDDVCVEIGSSPGGAAQLMLEMDAKVIAVDPAELDDEIMGHPNLTYIRKRGREVRKKEFKSARWLVADMNVAPKFTLDTIEDIVSNEQVNVSGVVLTLKLLEKSVAAEVNTFRERVAKWGFQVVKTRQLAFNRQEFCLVGLKDKFVLRSGKKRK
jgi:23S rRNA (cytidine2498-2'-O)-methyltransferase